MRAIGRIAGALCVVLCTATASAEGEQGSAVIDEVNVAASEVVLDGTRFEVTDRTRLEDENGVDLRLPELPSLAGGDSPDEAAVWFETSEGGGTGVRSLVRLRLTGAVPR